MIKHIILIIFLFVNAQSFSQSYKEFKSGFITIFKDHSEINSYYFGGNPALLNFNADDEPITITNNVSIDDGKFKKFIDPVSSRTYQLTASGKKAIDSVQKFKGSFGFQRVERKNWQWIFTRDYDNGNPFLIGDSTTGDTRLNGIVMNMQYSNNLSEKFSAGISIDYSVDEVLKEISPRPTSDHRDIYSRIGFNYLLSENFNIGLVADVYDINEKISYREDEGGLTKETVLLKFKGYDYPNVFRKKTETRYSYLNGYSGGLTFSHSLPGIASSAGYISAGFYKNTIKDDANDPRGEGFWKDDYIDGGLQVSGYLTRYLQAGLLYNMHYNSGWAKYSPYDVLYYKKEFSLHSIISGLQYFFNDNLSAGIEAGINLNSNDEKDYYSTVSCKVKSNILYGKAGLAVEWTGSFSSIISYGYFHKSVSEYSYTAEVQTNYLTDYRSLDLIYLYTPYNKHDFSAASRINPWFGGSFYIYLNYTLMKPGNNSVFGNETKSEFNSILEYRVKIF